MESDFELLLLGPFSLRGDGRCISLHPQSKRVVVFVALRERSVSRSVVAGNLWPLRTTNRANAALRSALWQIDKKCAGVLVHDGNEIRLSERTQTDIAQLHQAMDRVKDEAAESLPSTSVFRADLLPDWDEEWLLFERERLRQNRLHALENLCRQQTRRGNFGDAVVAGLAAVAAEPLRESAQRVLISAHLAEGNVVEARRQFDSFSRLLADELALVPSDELARLVDTI